MTLGYVVYLYCNLNEFAFSGISLPSQTAYSRVQAKMRGKIVPSRVRPRTVHADGAYYTPAVCDFVDRSEVTLVYPCIVLVSCTTNVFCILYSVQ